MRQDVQEQSFADGYTVGALMGRLKYQAPTQIKEWFALEKLKDIKGTLRKYHYSISAITAHPSDSTQVLIVADKIADGTDPTLIQAFAKDDRFMDGLAAGCLDGLLRYSQPQEIEEWVRVDNLDAIQRIVDDHGYTISSFRVHSDNKQWVLMMARLGNG